MLGGEVLIITITILSILLIILIIKIISLKKSVRKIHTDFSEYKKGDTNALIKVSSSDKDIRNLASQMNESLCEMRKLYLEYYQGDMEMKTAIMNISHDIRTPLTAISGYLELLGPIEKSEEVEGYLSIISERCNHMKKLTEEMFEYSIVSSMDNNNLNLEDVDLNRALEDCIMEYYGALTEKGIELKVDITEEKVIRKLDKVHTDRVFSNIVSNALKYSDGDLEISLDDKGTIIFANTAKGLEKTTVEKLFGRFYTVETAHHSTGLGLSIAKSFVEKMNGTIKAEYKNDKLYIILTFS